MGGSCLRNIDYYKLVSVFIQSFTIPIILLSSNPQNPGINNGSGFFLQLEQRKVLVTNYHVLASLIENEDEIQYKIGNYILGTSENIVFDQNLDLAVILISEEHAEELVYRQGKMFFNPGEWPYHNPRQKDQVILTVTLACLG